MIITDIEDAIYTWIQGETGTTTIFAYPDAPRPSTPYTLINFITTVQLGEKETDSTLLPDNSIDNIYSIPNEITLSINCYYDNAFQTANNIIDSIDKVTVQDQLQAAGLGFINATTVTKAPVIIHKQWEERARFDISFMLRSEITENIETIQKIEVTNEINGETIIINNP